MKQHYKQFSVFLGFVMVLVLALGFNVALLAQEKEAQTGEEDLDCGLKGLGYFQKEDYPAALECFQKALNLNPEEISYSIFLSIIYSKMDKFIEALQVLDDSLERISIGKKREQIQILRARVHSFWAEKLMKSYQYLTAISHFEEAYQIERELLPKNAA